MKKKERKNDHVIFGLPHRKRKEKKAKKLSGKQNGFFCFWVRLLGYVMMLYKNTKVKVSSSNEDIDYFDIVAGVPQGDTLAPYLFINCLD